MIADGPKQHAHGKVIKRSAKISVDYVANQKSFTFLDVLPDSNHMFRFNFWSVMEDVSARWKATALRKEGPQQGAGAAPGDEEDHDAGEEDPLEVDNAANAADDGSSLRKGDSFQDKEGVAGGPAKQNAEAPGEDEDVVGSVLPSVSERSLAALKEILNHDHEGPDQHANLALANTLLLICVSANRTSEQTLRMVSSHLAAARCVCEERLASLTLEELDRVRYPLEYSCSHGGGNRPLANLGLSVVCLLVRDDPTVPLTDTVAVRDDEGVDEADGPPPSTTSGDISATKVDATSKRATLDRRILALTTAYLRSMLLPYRGGLFVENVVATPKLGVRNLEEIWFRRMFLYIIFHLVSRGVDAVKLAVEDMFANTETEARERARVLNVDLEQSADRTTKNADHDLWQRLLRCSEQYQYYETRWRREQLQRKARALGILSDTGGMMRLAIDLEREEPPPGTSADDLLRERGGAPLRERVGASPGAVGGPSAAGLQEGAMAEGVVVDNVDRDALDGAGVVTTAGKPVEDQDHDVLDDGGMSDASPRNLLECVSAEEAQTLQMWPVGCDTGEVLEKFLAEERIDPSLPFPLMHLESSAEEFRR